MMDAKPAPLVTIGVETLRAELENLKPMFPAHFAELALDQELAPLDPQYDKYLLKESMGEVMFLACRHLGGIVGYFVGFVGPALHYRRTLTLTMDIFWIRPDFRGHGLGFTLFRSVEAEAKRRGVERMTVGSKCHKQADWLFEQLGYRKIETYYSVWLGPQTGTPPQSPED
jgi:GNAT superfamily N-acetyltransferase